MNTMTHSDCIAYLRTLPDASVDSCVTDPPYELGFMGKKWDSSGIAYSVELWREVLRALKPGAHLLAFGGTRTHHRMVCAIEDAGFEIRDEMQWLYGSGMPKSLNLKRFPICDCISEGDALPYTHEKTEHDLRQVREANLPQGEHDEAERGEILFPCVPKQGTHPNGTERTKPKARTGKQSGMEGRAIHRTGEGIRDDSQPEASASEAERLRVGAPADCREAVGQAAPGERGSASQEPDQDGQQAGKSASVFDASGALDDGALSGRGACPKCGKLKKAFEGFGSALKPSCETICVAQKPFRGTICANVLKHGTGGINVDGCRVEGKPRTTHADGNHTGNSSASAIFPMPNIKTSEPVGRWPSNCLLSHAEGCVCTGTKRVKASGPGVTSAENVKREWGGLKNDREVNSYAAADGLELVEAWQCVEGCPVRLLDEQSGESKSTTGVRDPNGTMGYHGGASGLPGIVSGHSDTGGASRFFYTAKASKSDREHFNTHATVKPLALMRYLVRLVTPPGGVVLDMFAGSGTTLVAARQEGFRFLGCDADEGHVRIAQDRLALELPFET